MFHLKPPRATINDTNPRLINFYRQIKENPKQVIAKAKTFQHPRNSPDPERPFACKNRKQKEIKKYYYQQREIFNNRPYGDPFDELQEAALFLYLNRTCYNGLYRENSQGGFNVPIGSYKNPDWVREEEILDAHRVLKSVSILNQDFECVLELAKPGDFIYFDPPYEPMSPTANFTDYSADGFGRDDQIRLLNLIKTLDENGVHFMLSNSGIMAQLYQDADFQVEIVQAKRAINSNGQKRGDVDEVIVTNYSLSAD